MPSFYRQDGTVQSNVGFAIPGADIAVLTQPADFSTQPGSPLANLYAAPSSNAATITGAVWEAGTIAFTFSATPPADVVEDGFIGVSGASPSGYNSTLSEPWEVLSVVGNVVTVAALTNPGTYVSGGTVATSVLPNPTQSDGNGNYYFYALPGIYSVQIYYADVELDFPDQDVGFASGGSVTSVALTMPTQFAVSGSPVTSTGTFGVTWNNVNPNLVLAGPTSGGAAAPTFRALTAADIAAIAGTVTSVAVSLTVPGSIFTSTVTGSPITTNGTIAETIGLQNQNANTVWAGPTSGGASQPTFRTIADSDLPGAIVRTAVASSVVTGTTTAGPDSLGATTSPNNRISIYFYTSTAGTGGTATLKISWTDPAGQAQSITTSTIDLTTLGSFQQATYYMANQNATNISYTVTVSGATGTPHWTFDLAWEYFT
jgi:hypothetical protein